MGSSLGTTHTEDLDNAGKDVQNGKRKTATGFCEANTSGNYGMETSRKRLSLALPLPPQSQKNGLCAEQQLADGVSASCKENKKPNSDRKKLSLGTKQPLGNAASLNYNNLASSSFRKPAVKSDCNRLSRKLSLRPLGESQQLNEVCKTEVLAETNRDARNWRGEFENSGLEGASSMSESIVVLDSDDSGDEEEGKTVSSRSRLSLARRGLKCKP